MAMLAETVDAVVGVDTHTDTHTACLLDHLGRQVAVITIAADPDGYRKLLGWAGQHAPGPRLAWSIEGTRSHGLGITRYLHDQGQLVAEAGRPARATRRPGGKSDPADAARAARDALAADQLAQPRADGIREALRILLTARAQATTARTAAVNTLKALILGAPDNLRQAIRGLSTPRQASKCRSLRVYASQPVAEQILRTELRRLATHIGNWDRELRANKAQLRQLVTQAMPVLLDQPGVGPMSAAQLLVSWSHPGRCRSEAAFATLAGVSPLEASSGRITRHRLNRFGDRELNRALHVIINWRMLRHPQTHGYMTRRRAEQKTDPEIRRCLKRYAARQLFRLMETTATT
ncbi:MAG: IS110 family transposase [Actinomycetota bacterium]|nr:IS110 family transposase [Actinomycetota bacterium]